MFLYAILFALSTLIMSAECETNEITFNLPEFFQQKDINKDGVLDKTEHKLSLKDLFDIDIDMDGFITFAEFNARPRRITYF
uniref:EF-hand domain-containing protein n=1 Tax=Arion vulgaris TaxID=1028688 RepID=A0A0B7AG20_9EUPU